MPQLEFMVATQDDKGRPTERKGWLQKVKTHTGMLGVAARRRKALQERVNLANESQERLAAAKLTNEQACNKFDEENSAIDSGPSAPYCESPLSVKSLEASIYGGSSKIESSPTLDQEPDLIIVNESTEGAGTTGCWVIRCREHQNTTEHIDCARCGPFEIHLPTETKHYRQCLQVQRWLFNQAKTSMWIDGTVDLFVHVSTGLTPRESTLMQFWLGDRRKMSPETLDDTSADPDSKASHAHPGACSTFTLTHLAMLEYHLSRLTGRLHPNFYCHRAEAYRVANDIFSNAEASLAVKFSALQDLHIMDLTIGRLDVLAFHAQARDHLLVSHSGLTEILTESRNSSGLVDTTNILLMVIWSTSINRFLDSESFFAASQDFIASLSGISKYVAVLGLQPSHNEIESHQRAATLAPLFLYLGSMVHHHLRQTIDSGCAETIGACTFTLLFDLVLSVAEIDGTVLAAVSRLERLQHYMMTSVKSNVVSDRLASEEAEVQLNRLAPCTVLVIFSHLRKYVEASSSGCSPLNPTQEAKVCSASINAVRLFPLLSSATRSRVARGLLECLVGITVEEGVNPFDEQAIGEIATELRSSWMAQKDD